MNDAGPRTKRQRKLPEPRHSSAASIIFQHTGSERLRGKRKIIANPSGTADKLNVAPEFSQCQVQGVVDEQPPWRDERTIAQVKGIGKAKRVHKIRGPSKKNRFDVGARNFDMPHGENHAGLVMFGHLTRDLEPAAQLELGITVVIERQRRKPRLESKIGVEEKWIFIG